MTKKQLEEILDTLWQDEKVSRSDWDGEEGCDYVYQVQPGQSPVLVIIKGAFFLMLVAEKIVLRHEIVTIVAPKTQIQLVGSLVQQPKTLHYAYETINGLGEL